MQSRSVRRALVGVTLAILVGVPFVQVALLEWKWHHTKEALEEIGAFWFHPQSPKLIRTLDDFGIRVQDVQVSRKGNDLVVQYDGTKTLRLFGLIPLERHYHFFVAKPIF